MPRPNYSRPDAPLDIKPFLVRPGFPVPLETPPPPAALPPLPSPARSPSFASAYTLSTHLVQAAYPRTHPHSPVPVLAGAHSAKDARKRRVEASTAAALYTRLAYEDGAFAGEPGSTVPLWAAVNRYVNKRLEGKAQAKGRGLTLFLTHANGFVKEYWEPVMHRVLSTLSSDASAPVIDEIWVLEWVNHGDSALVNGSNLGCLFDWWDCARDVSNFLLYYLPDAASGAALPTHLERLPRSIAEARQRHGFSDRTIVGIGHSMGSTMLALSAITQPILFSSLFLVDPVCTPPDGLPREALQAAQAMCIGRRERWPSRAAALQTFKSMSYFDNWDPAALDLFLACGLCPDRDAAPHLGPDDGGDGPVKLKMPAVQEGICFETLGPHEAWELLPTLDPRVQLHVVLTAEETIYSGPMEFRRELAWRRPENATNTILESGHLVVQEVPDELAEVISSFLLKKYGARQHEIPRPKL